MMHEANDERPVLLTTRLRLRPLRLDDAAAQRGYACDPAVTELGMWDVLSTLEDNEQDLRATIARCERGETVEWGLERSGESGLIGRCSLLHLRPDHRSAELGYALARPHWGQGYMSEAVAAVLADGFGARGLHRVEAVCLAHNAGSLRVLRKAGFQLEGTARAAYLLRDTYQDLHRFGLLHHEWQEQRPGSS